MALAGAGAIAVSPISPVAAPAPDVVVAAAHSSSAAVELTALTDMLANPALVDPVTGWLEVFGTAFDNVAQIGGEMAAHPFPILQQVIANQMGYGQLLTDSVQAAANSYIQFFTSDEDYRLKYFAAMALDYLASGNVAGAASVVSNIVFRLFAFANPLINIMQIPLGMGQNVMNALATVPELLMPVGLGVLNPVEGVINVIGDSAQSVLDAVNAGDPAAALTALINTPAVLTGAVLNGYYNGIAAGTSGLLTAAQAALNRGVLETLLVTVPQTIARAIGWPGPNAIQAPETAGADAPAVRTDVKTDLPTESPAVQDKALTPAVQDKTPTPTGLLSGFSAGRTDAVDRITETVVAAVDTVKTVTLSVTPQLKVAKTQTAGAATEIDSADAGTGSTKTTGNDASAPGAGADSSATSDSSTDTKPSREDRKASKEAKRSAKQQTSAARQQARQEAKAQLRTAKQEDREAKQEAKTPSSGGKHRAGADHSE
ncbi:MULTISPECIES: hypothetical protein [unclassified Mycolicibacterium]|uniref:hypothetical protein n=1 Tax=unclassified Mycolicibacterium TaxID=2636767 RepID=UPI0012DE1A8C|nr:MULTISPECIES: hypothetical protein [unclassified Mycolicibacterium]MUL81487.1 hypothetical protein [Mycolicibacterium sp. CBMA 329]MUL87253.1 hypothetical protein [Mycolicibacterium sp. CBMA 331]MUL98465.1 hypothetical protein [Mycolicibacterium sp. CBMA 334]MUM25222.1 hypothetical protein [Mycolicibacterium sp. CBMA 295]MUM37550.1 hypothetical protein [Mycolicibacterium sp. CBMA 247]